LPIKGSKVRRVVEALNTILVSRGEKATIEIRDLVEIVELDPSPDFFRPKRGLSSNGTESTVKLLNQRVPVEPPGT
jgi:hypothetical protein